ncbi:heparanase-like isoform X2 [Patiria miniata]|uniref:Heparanase n=1 Tax=Patiria miniata TaxID=46514 RepID=A0A914A5B4_PATMI|nr:heparanase-like isoform X2 [Patiria miniata]
MTVVGHGRTTMVSDLFLFLLVFAQAVSVANCVTPDRREGQSTISNYEVDVRANAAPIHITGERFLSVAVDTNSLNKHWMHFNFSSAKLQTMTRALSPAYLRLGGRAGDFLIFKNPCDGSEPSTGDTGVEDPLTYLCPQDWDDINNFCSDTGLKLIFGLNLLLRTEAGGWDPDNAEHLLDYNTHDVAWELGNEPNSFKKKANITLSGSQIGIDFNLLRTVLNNRVRYVGASVYGPDIGSVGRKKTSTMLEGFLSKTNTTNATTFHSYYLNGRIATVDDFLDPETLDGLLPGQIDLVESLVSKYREPGSRVWLGETGSAFGGGAPNISDRFVAGFLFLDKLGMSARMGLDTVIRQTYYGGHYTMLDLENLDPKPDYWIAYIYKRLVGRRVLRVKITPPTTGSTPCSVKGGDKQYVRVYAHCTSTNQSGYDAGAVTLIVLNMHKNDTANITLARKLGGRTIQQYLLTPYGPEGMTSPEVNLNDSPLHLKDDTSLPEIEPVVIKRGKPMLVPPLSYGFYVVAKAKAKACLS